MKPFSSSPARGRSVHARSAPPTAPPFRRRILAVPPVPRSTSWALRYYCVPVLGLGHGGLVRRVPRHPPHRGSTAPAHPLAPEAAVHAAPFAALAARTAQPQSLALALSAAWVLVSASCLRFDATVSTASSRSSLNVTCSASRSASAFSSSCTSMSRRSTSFSRSCSWRARTCSLPLFPVVEHDAHVAASCRRGPSSPLRRIRTPPQSRQRAHAC